MAPVTLSSSARHHQRVVRVYKLMDKLAWKDIKEIIARYVVLAMISARAFKHAKSAHNC